MSRSYQNREIEIISSYFTVPTMGFLPINAFVIKAKEPILIDTGMATESEAFMAKLNATLDLKDLKWIWITHDDCDHVGNLQQILEAAPHAKIIGNSLAIMRMSTAWQIPLERTHWLNPGESIQIGDRKLTALRPPLFDNPTTIAVFDEKSQSLFSGDFFGAIISQAAENVDALDERQLLEGMLNWTSLDCPWVHLLEQNNFKAMLNKIQQMNVKSIFSSHLPPAEGKTKLFLDNLALVPQRTPFMPPNHSFLEELLHQEKNEPTEKSIDNKFPPQF